MSFEAADRHARVCDFGDELSHALTAAPHRTPSAGALEMAHVLFLDLVGYSLLPMDQQKEYLAQLQRVVRESPRFRGAEANGDIISLPTGDGMALAFFVDPTAPATCALEIAAALKNRPHLQLRMGIHSGPVYRLADVNANANVAGGGINMAQRVMDCGDAGHILLSKSVADTLSQLSNWAPYLTDLGEHAVKHGVRVHLYNLCTAELGNQVLPQIIGRTNARKAVPWRGAMLAIVLALAGLGAAGWFLLKQHTSETPLQLRYSITVQRFRDGKQYGNQFRLPGEMIFEQGYKIAIDVAASQHGFLYVLNEGPNGEKGTRSIMLLEPRNGASAERPSLATIRIPAANWFQFDAASGTETCYLVWAKAPVPELERLKALPVYKGGVLIEDPAVVGSLHDFLAKQVRQKVDVTRNEQERQTELRTNGRILIHPIRLEHQ
jgi:class 3 adenylate cyclase